jgi:hypothetical protein
MRTTDPEFWEELTRGRSNEQLPDVAETLQEDLEFDTELEDKDTDDSDVSMQTLITAMTGEVVPVQLATRTRSIFWFATVHFRISGSSILIHF